MSETGRRIRRSFLGAVLTLATVTAATAGVTAPARAAAPVTVSVDRTVALTPYQNGNLAALSFGAQWLAKPEVLRSDNLAAHLRTLGNSGIRRLRLGGNGVDTSFWTRTNEPTPAWAKAVITPAGIDALAELALDSGWNVVLGVNLKEYDPFRAADEVAYAVSKLGSRLSAVQIGNEPDKYGGGYGGSQFWAEWTAYRNAILARSPGVIFYGPTTAGIERAQPIFYGLLAARLVGNGQFLRTVNSDLTRLRAYVVRDGGRLTVALINVQNPAVATPTPVTLHLGSTYSSAVRADLRTTDPAGLSAKTGISIGGGTVGTDGTLTGLAWTPVTVGGSTVQVSVPAGSAALIRFN